MRKVLVAYDGSAEAWRAVEHAAALEGVEELTVISVAPIQIAGRPTAVTPDYDPGDGGATPAEARTWLASRGVPAKTLEVTGHPAAAIVEEAEKGDFDLIVLGSRGLNAVERFLLGSTSLRVVTHAPCSVLVVR